MVGLATEKARPNLHYDLINPKTGLVYRKPKSGWRYDEARMDSLIKEGRILWPENPSGRPRQKVFLSELSQEYTGFSSIVGQDIYTRNGTAELDEIMGERKLDFPKPSALVKELIQQVAEKESIILDSFAGSGTTAHAVLALNKEDGGNRKFILVECEDYADSITAERVRRVIKGVSAAKNEDLRKGLGGTFSYFELGRPMELEGILSGGSLPSYRELAGYVFYTATGETFNEKYVDIRKNFIGESATHQVFLFYEPDIDKLKSMALTLEIAEKLPPLITGKRRLIFAPTKYLDQEYLEKYKIDFAQLPFEIYQRVG